MVAAPSPSPRTTPDQPARKQNDDHGYGPLLARGIDLRTLSRFAVSMTTRYGYPYWRYPVHGVAGAVIAWRYKRAGDDRGRRKYDWGTTSEPDPVWPGRPCPGPQAGAVYNIAAVQDGKEAIVAAGEPDVWLLSSLGLSACSLLAGEGAVPAAAVDALAARRPAQVTIIYDNDDVGRRGAHALLSATQARGLVASAHVLPTEVGPKGDVTDFYRLCGQQRAAFVERLCTLPPLPVPPQEPAQSRRPTRTGPRLTGTVWPGASPIEQFKARHDLVDVVEAAGVVLRSHQGGAYLQACCPFHDDHSPSFVLWPERGYWKCYGCGLRGDVLDFIKMRETG